MTLSSIFSLYRPFLTLQSENRRHWVLISLLCLGNLVQAILIVLSNNCLNLFLGILISPSLSFVALCWAGVEYLLMILTYTVVAGFNSFVGDKLIEYFNVVIETTFEKWINSKTYVGVLFLSNRKVVNAAGIFSYDIQEANRLSVKLTDSFLNTLFASLAGLYGLWQLSLPLNMQVGSLLLIVPGYMAIGALIYALINNLIINRFTHQLEEVTEKQHALASKLEAQVHHVEKHAEGIELLGAATREKKNFSYLLKLTTAYHAILAKLQARLVAFMALNDHLRYFVGIVLSIPQILSKKMSIDNLLVVSDYFERVTRIFTWEYDNCEELTYLKVMISKLKAIQEEMDEWTKIQSKNELKIKKSDEISFKSLIIKKRDQSPLLSVETFTFKKNQITLIQGPSGGGKSTIIKTINRSWPFAQGVMVLPCERSEIYIIPQKTVFPHQSTLYEAILYPLDQQLMSEEYKLKIDELLMEFKFDANVINEREDMRDWGKTLSGGEQQRIALIRIILFKPKVLLMDEPFSALNPELQLYCEQRLSIHLKANGTTTLLIDHRDTRYATQQPTFYDEIVYLKNRTLVRNA